MCHGSPSSKSGPRRHVDVSARGETIDFSASSVSLPVKSTNLERIFGWIRLLVIAQLRALVRRGLDEVLGAIVWALRVGNQVAHKELEGFNGGAELRGRRLVRLCHIGNHRRGNGPRSDNGKVDANPRVGRRHTLHVPFQRKLVAAYKGSIGKPRRPAREEVAIKRPPPAARMAGNTALDNCTVP